VPRTARAVNATSSAWADDANAAWGNPKDRPNHVGITLTRSPVANRWRRARDACGRVDRLTPVGSRSDGPRPRSVRWLPYASTHACALHRPAIGSAGSGREHRRPHPWPEVGPTRFLPAISVGMIRTAPS